MKKYIFLLLIITCLFACKSNKTKVDVSNINLEVNVIRFDKDFFALPTDSVGLTQKLPDLRAKYSYFFELYNQGIIGVGESTSPVYVQHIPYFFRANAVQSAWTKVNEVFTNDAEAELNQKLTNAFKHYKYYFPEAQIPEIYTYVSGFNQSIALADGLIGIGLDKYLGQDYEGYTQLGTSRYLTQKMYRDKIVSDCVHAWGVGEFPMNELSENNLISKMIYEGKLLYFDKQILPSEVDTTVFGFTDDQLKWCIDNERPMWTTVIENKLLFTTDHLTLIKLTEDAPHTSIFTVDSPGRACNWIGYMIVCKYMEETNSSLAELMSENDLLRIFNKSKYKP